MIKEIEITTVPCTSCGGSGILPGENTGRLMKRLRKSRGISNIKDLIKHFPYSLTYTFDLECDRRAWNNTLVAQYKQAIEDTIKERLEKLDANGS